MGLTERVRQLEMSTIDGWFSARLGRIIGPTGEHVLFVHRRHWLVLLGPTALVVVGCLVLVVADEPRTWLVLWAAASILLHRWRERWSPLRTAVAVAAWFVPLWLTLGVPTELFRAGSVLALLVFLLVVIARWWCDVLVLTQTSLWKLSGVITTSAPKAPLTRIVFQDVRQNLVEKVLRCGTLSFDTASTSDDPLAHFGPIDDPFVISAEIHRQRLHSSPAARPVVPPQPPTP